MLHPVGANAQDGRVGFGSGAESPGDGGGGGFRIAAHGDAFRIPTVQNAAALAELSPAHQGGELRSSKLREGMGVVGLGLEVEVGLVTGSALLGRGEVQGCSENKSCCRERSFSEMRLTAANSRAAAVRSPSA